MLAHEVPRPSQEFVFRRVRTPAGIDDVMLTERQFIEHVADHDDGREQYVGRLLATLTDPAEVWVQAVEPPRGVAYRRILLAAFRGKEPAATAVVAEEDPLGLLSWTFFKTLAQAPRGRGQDVNGRRRGYLLYRRGGAGSGGG